MLVYGKPGVGKTVFGASGPRPTLFLDVDYGTLSISDLTDGVYRLELRSWTDFKDILLFLRSAFNNNPAAYRTIVVDNITELQRVLMQSITENKSIPTIQDWGTVLNQMQYFVRKIRELPCNTVFVAHEGMKENQAVPALSGQIAQELPGYFDIVARYTLVTRKITNPDQTITEEDLRYLRCHPTETAVAKDRSGKLDAAEPPNLTKLITKATTPAAAAKPAVTPTPVAKPAVAQTATTAAVATKPAVPATAVVARPAATAPAQPVKTV